MNIYTKAEAISIMNKWSNLKIPFLFIIDYEIENVHIIALDKVDPNSCLFDFNGINNIPDNYKYQVLNKEVSWNIYPDSLLKYESKFNSVINSLKRGDSFLTNLTAKTEIETNLSLDEIFIFSKAKYKLLIKDKFCSLSPESFIKIIDNKIYSYPMKGTIDADIKDAASVILNDNKERAEHATIVDLIRNDLSIISKDVKVDEYRYIDKIKTNKGDILQVSSCISGYVVNPENLNLGNILFSLIPAGSICGAPKTKTLEIIKNSEKEKRGYYTGVAGIFDGRNVDSAVLIRSIEKDKDNKLWFRSGGGITAKSSLENEYKELIQKVYLPILS